MADFQIPREAVEAGARAMCGGDWDNATVIVKHRMREFAADALNAAAPLIVAAAYEQFAESIDTITDPASDAWMRAEKCGMRDVTRQLLQRAEQLRAQT